MTEPQIGDKVKIENPSHRMHGKYGVIVTEGSFIPDSWGVEVKDSRGNASTYGFLSRELKVLTSSALRDMVEKLDNKKRGMTGYVTYLPEVKAILNELTDRVPASIIHTNTTGPAGDISVQITIGFTLERDLL